MVRFLIVLPLVNSVVPAVAVMLKLNALASPRAPALIVLATAAEPPMVMVGLPTLVRLVVVVVSNTVPAVAKVMLIVPLVADMLLVLVLLLLNMPVLTVRELMLIVPAVSVVVLVAPIVKLLLNVHVPPVPLNATGKSCVVPLPVIVSLVVAANVHALVPAVSVPAV